MTKDFQQITWDASLEAAWRQLLRLAVAEDLQAAGDWTTRSLVPEDVSARACIAARQPGTIAGLPAAEITFDRMRLQWSPEVEDGQAVESGHCIGRIEGPAQGILIAERLVLNLLGHLSGIATLTRRYVDAVASTRARIYDTRKTTPGWRRLEKYAVRCGGGHNHRTGLFDAVLIKDNHLALGQAVDGAARYTPAEAVQRARSHAKEHGREDMIIEVEVDTLDQFSEVLPAGPDIVLLDNMSPATLREAVALRDASAPAVELEASGGIHLETVGAVAQTGIDRISVGALTHSAVCLDLGLDWDA